MTAGAEARRRGRAGAAGAAAAGGRARIALTVNGERHDLLVAGYKTLLEVLREDLGLTGTKHGCELGECGACAVQADDAPVLSCLLLALECDGARITTVEGLARGPELSALQAAFADKGAAQCGYCTPGILVTAQALLDRNPHPTRQEITEALSGNLCRCTGYLQIFEAVEEAAGTGGARGTSPRRARGGRRPRKGVST
ncbi:MAG TPA: (2Fe-2S)-binding protein [Gemmatimonadales bacterium]|nr:(2Fe-2S)-binding protein [Gemmatimonadales bacterium]